MTGVIHFYLEMSMHCSYYSQKGRFNLFRDEEQVQIVLTVKVGEDKKSVSMLWDVDSAPEVDGLPPSEVLDLLEDRLKSYWLYTSRDEVQARIDWMRQFPCSMDSVWAKAQIERHQKQIESLHQYVLDDEDLHELARTA